MTAVWEKGALSIAMMRPQTWKTSIPSPVRSLKQPSYTHRNRVSMSKDCFQGKRATSIFFKRQGKRQNRVEVGKTQKIRSQLKRKQ